MQFQPTRLSGTLRTAALLLTCLLAACGGGGSGGSGSTPPNPAPPPSQGNDTVRPSVTLSTGIDQLAFDSFDIEVQFSEAVNDLALEDFTIAGATLADLRESGSNHYDITATPTGGHVTISLPADKASDAAGNGNIASNSLTVEDKAAPESLVTFPTKRSLTDTPRCWSAAALPT